MKAAVCRESGSCARCMVHVCSGRSGGCLRVSLPSPLRYSWGKHANPAAAPHAQQRASESCSPRGGDHWPCDHWHAACVHLERQLRPAAAACGTRCAAALQGRPRPSWHTAATPQALVAGSSSGAAGGRRRFRRPPLGSDPPTQCRACSASSASPPTPPRTSGVRCVNAASESCSTGLIAAAVALRRLRCAQLGVPSTPLLAPPACSVFHTHCLEQSLEHNRRCPQCRVSTSPLLPCAAASGSTLLLLCAAPAHAIALHYLNLPAYAPLP